VAVVGLRDSDAAAGGGVYMLYEAQIPAVGWVDQKVAAVAAATAIASGGVDVWDVALSPSFDTDNQVVAVIENVTTTKVTTKLGVSGWNAVIGDGELEGDNTAANKVTANDIASIIFPDDYELDTNEGIYGEFYVGISDNDTYGDVYSFYGGSGADASVVIDLNCQAVGTDTDVTSLAVSGDFANAVLIAGTKLGGEAKVKRSADAGETWYSAKKEPTGTTAKVYVVVADDYADTEKAWAAVGGLDGAVSKQAEDRKWNQIGLINTTITAIKDLSFGSMFMATDNGTSSNSSVWRQASNWERVFSSSLQDANAAEIDLVEVSPDYASDSTVFLGNLGSTDKIFRSTDGGNLFTAQLKATTAAIKGWVVIDNQTIITGSVGGTYKTTTNGRSWTTLKSCTGATDVESFVLSPSFADDETILAGTQNGKVFRSTNTGTSWSERKTTAMANSVVPAFSNDYANDGIYYCTAEGGGVWRYEEGVSTTWARIDTKDGFPVDADGDYVGAADIAAGNGLVMSSDGTVYATANYTEDATNGMSRCLDPTNSVVTTPYPFFEQVNDTVEGTITKEMSKLWLTEDEGINTLWTIYDSAYVYSLCDSLTGSPISLSPCGAGSLRADRVSLDWEEMTGATKYEIDVHTAEAFKGGMGYVVDGDTETDTTVTEAISSTYAGMELWWRVRVYQGKPYRSRWSDLCQFSTALVGGAWNPFQTAAGYPGGYAPESGATGVPLKPAFNWNAADWATGYDFGLYNDASFRDPIVEKVLPSTVYEYAGELAYSTTYYWRVRAAALRGTSEQYSEWAEGVFTTMAEPVAPLPPVVVEPTPPAPPAAPPVEIPVPAAIPTSLLWAIVGIGAVLVIALIILIVRTRRAV